MNKVIIMGNLGQDPDTRYMPSGQAATNISVATNRTWKDKDSGEKREEVSWHRCVAYGKTAETIQEYFSKGRKILIEGRLKYGSYEKDGITRYTTDIVIERFEFVESKGQGGDSRPHPSQEAPHPGDEGLPQDTGEPAETNEFEDDIPFMLPHPA